MSEAGRYDGAGAGAKDRVQVTGASVPRFAPHVSFRFDQTRGQWIMLAPERLFMPDEQAVAVLKLVDGVRTVDVMVDELARVYQADRAEIAGDVVALLQDLVDKRVMTA